jgi:hypothetical protein
MKKSLLLASLLAIGATSAVAMDTQWFVGLDASKVQTTVDETISGSATINGRAYAASGSASTDVDDTSLGIKVGAILDKTHRVSLHYTKYDFDYDSYMNITTLSYDYLFNTNGKFTPFIGAHVGYGKVSAYDLVDDSGMLYGAQAGVIYELPNNFELEAGLALTGTNISPSTSASFSDSTVSVTGNYSMDIGTITTMYFGINYKF